MVSRENKVITLCIVLAILLLGVVLTVSDPPTWVSGMVILGVGVIAPMLVNEYLDRRDMDN
ncbi:hypothetical protein U4E84_09835 [Halorubrum sp. AD140]|uniref:hypothetical protein n=1 Tax=Halorubrum sp. AD140 TaxID=3050073 RepID=UPI002ACC5A30|nr:hypothetical protein [Halorubrum sp. AD140]MDZ5811641.1 hypothetical protein [Halorubrum sp. AD140]